MAANPDNSHVGVTATTSSEDELVQDSGDFLSLKWAIAINGLAVQSKQGYQRKIDTELSANSTQVFQGSSFQYWCIYFPALYSTLVKILVANIDTSLVITDVYTYVGIIRGLTTKAFFAQCGDHCG